MIGSLHQSSLHRLAISVAALVLLLAVAACGGSGDHVASAAEAVAATVNGSPVHASQVDGIRAERRLTGEADTARAALNDAIDRELLRQEASRLGVVAQPAAVAQRLAALQGQAGGADQLKAALQRAKMTQAQFRQSATDWVLREQLQNAKFAGLAAAAATVRAYYRSHLDTLFRRQPSVHLGAIQVRTKMVAQNAIDRLNQGRPFSEVARQFSQDAESRANGGDLGWLLTDSLPGPLRKALLSARPGIIAKPVGGGFTWYVLNVMGLRPAGALPFDSVRGPLREQLTHAKRAKALEAWLVRERGQATITRP